MRKVERILPVFINHMNEMNGVVGKLLLSVNVVESVILNLLSITRITNCFWWLCFL